MAGTRKRKKEQIVYDYKSPLLGIELRFSNVPGGYTSMHFHEELEIMYPLNGDATIRLEKKRYQLPKRQLTVVEAGQLHGTTLYNEGMALTIRVSKKALVALMPQIEGYHIHCIPTEIPVEKFPEYVRACGLMEELTKSFIRDERIYEMEANGLILQCLSLLLRNFASTGVTEEAEIRGSSSERIREVIRFVQEHYTEAVSLQDVCDLVGLGKESFCRYFKQRTGMSFLTYLNEVRLTACYRDLAATDDPVSIIMEKNGIRSQKQFNSSFRKLYGCTPSSVRKAEPAPRGEQDMKNPDLNSKKREEIS